MDDYNIILDFLNKYTQADWSTRIEMIFKQYGEHRLVPSKLLYVSYYYLTGSVNFKTIGLIGDVQLVFISLVAIHFIKKCIPEYWRFISFVWMLCIFDLNTYENACMTMNGVGNYGVIALFFVSLYFYDLGKKYIPLAVFFQLLCTLSNANGLAASIFIVIFTFSTLNKAKIISACVTSLIVIGWYLISYHTATLPGKLPFDLTRLMTYFIRMSGAHFSFDNSFAIGLLLLTGLIIVFPYRSIWDPKIVPVLCIFLFVTSTMVLAAIFRAPYRDAQFQTSRYLIYPQLMIGCLVLFIFMKLNTQQSKIIGTASIGLVMLITYNWNCQFGKLGFQRTKFRAETRKYWHPNPADCEKICKRSCESGIYCIEDNR